MGPVCCLTLLGRIGLQDKLIEFLISLIFLFLKALKKALIKPTKRITLDTTRSNL